MIIENNTRTEKKDYKEKKRKRKKKKNSIYKAQIFILTR